jgi:DNA-binding beta-propeller fold protein YncE
LRITALAPSPRPAPTTDAPASPIGWRSRGRLAALAALLAAVGAVLLVLSGRDGAPLAIRMAPPAGLAVLDGRVWVTAPRAGTVTPVDAEGRVGAPVKLGGAPGRIAAGANGLWVTDAATGRIVGVEVPPPAPPNAAVDGPTAFAPLRAGADASDVALAADAVWVASTADRRVYALEPGGKVSRIDAGEGPVAIAADARRVVAVDAPAGSLTVIDAPTRAFSGQVRVGGTPVDVALSGDAAWVADAERSRLVRVDLGGLRVTHTLAIGRRPVALAAAGDDLYVLVAGDRELVKVTGGVVQWRRSLPAAPTALAVDERHVWVGAGQLLRYGR